MVRTVYVILALVLVVTCVTLPHEPARADGLKGKGRTRGAATKINSHSQWTDRDRPKGKKQKGRRKGTANEVVYRRALARGRKATRLGHYAEAVREFTRALKVRPLDARVLNARGNAYLLGGDPEAAARDLRAAWARTTDRRLRAAIQYNIGRAAELLGDLAKAQKAYETSVQLRRSKAALSALARVKDIRDVVWVRRAQAEATRPGTCRALVNTATTDPDGAVLSYQVVDVQVSPRPTAHLHPGLVVGERGHLWRLDVVSREARVPMDVMVDLTYDELYATDVATGTTRRWLSDTDDFLGFTDFDCVTTASCAPESEQQSDTSDEEDRGEEDRSIVVTATIGPYVSLVWTDTGYTGGAHGIDNPNVMTLAAPDGRRVSPIDLVGDTAVEAMRKPVAAAAAAYKEGHGTGYPPTMPSRKELADSAFTLDCWAPLCLETVISCCTWPENHNNVFVTAPLYTLPPRMQRLLARTPEGLWEAPDHCGAVGLNGGSLSVRVGREGPMIHIPLGDKWTKVLGVIWL